MASAADRILSGYVANGKFTYERIVKIKPIQHDYGNGYYKYSCPICNRFENPHQLSPIETNCPLCGVNLTWDDFNL